MRVFGHLQHEYCKGFHNQALHTAAAEDVDIAVRRIGKTNLRQYIPDEVLSDRDR
ncbi:hypothetical protein [Tichowtungia aerotolerans]|uniref:Uncharacterized protein n=1 Tax=Tichowtungia aerotolerans TaxID=2697043 RepID=A0A6P1M6T6_9BACT|nr:hypothetical protein [Tichowtungia aerotolerans]QHI68304.1 hypothetical protein GT409_02140 [Tichowtungia aerotolerans]